MIKIALVGRPNVGKSALFNRLCKKKISLVDPTEGVTRDRLYGHSEFNKIPFTLIDTGGIDPHSKDPFIKNIIDQSQKAIEEADRLIFVVDGQVGPTALDKEVAALLLRSKKPLILAINKSDSFPFVPSYEFYALGIEMMQQVSSLHGHGIEDLLDQLLVDATASLEESPKRVTLAILGRPNVGKSTLINALLSENRLITSPLAGTTRDAIDIPLKLGNRHYLLIDTPGVRRKKKLSSRLDKLSFARAKESIERADLLLLVCSAEEGMTEEEKRLHKEIVKAKKGCILLFNKWDLIKGFRMEHCAQALNVEHAFLEETPFLFISALKKRNLKQITGLLEIVLGSREKKIPTPQLNRFLQKAILMNSPPLVNSKRLTFYYGTQKSTSPPHFIFFVNNPRLLHATYKKYLEKQLKKEFGLLGTPISFELKGKEKAHQEE